MRSVFALFSLVFSCLLVLLFVSTARAQDCKAVTIKTCPSFFDHRCRNDDEFQKNNGFACLQVLNNGTRDQAFCATIDTAQCEAVVPAVKVVEQDCSKIESLRDRIMCEDGFPSCASGTPELKNRFLGLGEEVRNELESYGGVLDLDLDNVRDKKALCGQPFDKMEGYYNQANKSDSTIKVYLDRSRGIASCAKDINKWVENQKIVTADSDIQDNLIKATAEDLKNLQPLREELNRSVRKLKEAGPKLYQLMKFHVRFCPSN